MQGLVHRGGPITTYRVPGRDPLRGLRCRQGFCLGLEARPARQNGERQKTRPETPTTPRVAVPFASCFQTGPQTVTADFTCLFLTAWKRGSLQLSAPRGPWGSHIQPVPGAGGENRVQRGPRQLLGGPAGSLASWPFPLSAHRLRPRSSSSLCSAFQTRVQEGNPVRYRSWGKEERGWWRGLFFQVMLLKGILYSEPTVTGVRREGSGLPTVPSVMAGRHIS